ncbi:MAG: ATP-binding protein [Pseudomonadota bacterium]|nr:ATP-binding protein [Pseudomonadota bacterium]
MTSTAQLRTLSVAALKNAVTLAGQDVFSPRDWPTWGGSYPVILVQTPFEEKTSIGRNVPEFTVTATLKVTARVQSLAASADAGAAAAEADLEIFKNQIEVALINNPTIMPLLQQIAFVRSQMEVNAEGEQHIGELVMEFGLEFYQGPEAFNKPVTTALTEITLTVTEPSGTTEPAIDVYPPQ